MKKWSFTDIPDQSGRTVLVTGASSGIGFHISRMLAEKGAEVILTYRNANEAEKAVHKIVSEHPKARLTTVKLELADLHSVEECAKEIKSKYNHLDLLINNAGVMVPPFTKTQQDFELQMGTNHLGHFALTGHLLPLLIHTPASRIVSVSSLAAFFGIIDLNDLNYKHRPYKKWEAYEQSKLAILLFIRSLAEKLERHKLQTMAVASHPGGALTNLQRTSSFFMRRLLSPFITQPPSGAAMPTLRAACDSTVFNGSYWGPSAFFGLKGSPEPAKIPRKALDGEMASKLWNLSEQLTGVKYKFE